MSQGDRAGDASLVKYPCCRLDFLVSGGESRNGVSAKQQKQLVQTREEY